MVVGLLDLPNECLLVILSMLRIYQVKTVAYTFNHRLTPTALTILAPLRRIMKDEAYFETTFDDIIPLEYYIWSPDLRDFFNQEDRAEEPRRPSHHLNYLHLTGDLKWFERFADKEHSLYEGPPQNQSIDYKDLDHLIESVSRLGLTLPPAFLKFMRTPKHVKLLECVAEGISYFTPLHKIRLRRKIKNSSAHCPSSSPEFSFPLASTANDSPKDGLKYEYGYIFTFFRPYKRRTYSALEFGNMYLDRAGRHAIFSSEIPCHKEQGVPPEDNSNLTDDERHAGVVIAPLSLHNVLLLRDVDFERWLVQKYYTDWIKAEADELINLVDRVWTREWDDGEIPDHVLQYWYNAYSKEGRALQ